MCKEISLINELENKTLVWTSLGKERGGAGKERWKVSIKSKYEENKIKLKRMKEI